MMEKKPKNQTILDHTDLSGFVSIATVAKDHVYCSLLIAMTLI